MVSGTVDGRTTQEILYLTNSDGTYQIKIDASTDLSECKAMVKGRKVTVGFNWGNDGYNHATKVVGVAESRTATDVDSANALTVRGTVGEATTEGMLRLINSDGEMKVKLDTSTNWGSCRTLVYKQNVTVTVARGSDGYMHALAINPSGGNSGGSSNGSASSSSGTPVSSDNALIVQGTVGSGINEGMLYLSTSGGTMSIKIDGNTNFAASRSMMPGENIAVACYRGSDAYYHAFSVVNSTQPGSATVNASEAVTVSGTVESGTNGGLLVLKTGDGNMMIKLDNSTRMGGCKVLTQGRSVKVGVARGSDAYMHAVSID